MLVLTIFLLFTFINTPTCQHSSTIDRWDKVRVLPPLNVKIVKLDEKSLDYELKDKNLVIVNRSLTVTDKTGISEAFKKEMSSEKSMKFILYCDEHKTLYQADILYARSNQ
jgi:hypothetical protein